MVISFHLLLDLLGPVCTSLILRFLSCSLAGLLRERTCTLVPTLPQSCRGFHVRCNNSGECSAAAAGGHAPDRSAVEARRAPGQAEHCRSSRFTFPPECSASCARYNKSSQKKQNIKSGGYKAALNVKKEHYKLRWLFRYFNF